MQDHVIRFDDWEAVLKASVPADFRQPYREAIVKFRYWLGETGRAPNVAAFKEHLAWTSEKTYRGWCRRFIAACGSRPVERLGHEEVRRWLSDLAVMHTAKQTGVGIRSPLD